VSARSPGAIACVVVAAAALVTGCGGKRGTVEGGNDTFSATTLTVYSNLPWEGPDAGIATSISNGEALALYQAGGHVGRLHVSFTSLNDAGLHTGTPSTEVVGASAHTASNDQSTAAYIGDLDSASTQISLPLNNENDILQISPGSSYVGFTDPSRADIPGDPTTYYANRHRTFARLIPSDAVQAAATVRYMRMLGVRRLAVIADSADPRAADIAPLVAAAATSAGITVVTRGTVSTAASTTLGQYAALAGTVAAAHPDAVLLGSDPDNGAATLWGDLHTSLPAAKLFAPANLALPAFLGSIGAAAGATYVTSPYLEIGQYPASARTVFRRYRAVFGIAPTVYSLYGYEAMRVVLLAIARAGRRAASRTALLATFWHLGTLNGVIGSYHFDSSGDTSIDRFDGYRVGAGGSLVLDRVIPPAT
jgi:ABC-type branched-subunit amino acid transport system substrate-binding protein